MILTLQELITPDELALIRQKIAAVAFTDGRATAGELLHKAKNNQQIPGNHPVMKDIAHVVMQALGRCDPFMSLAQPRRLATMLVSRYEPGMAYGLHVDAPIMGEPNHVRSDVSFTLFLSDPDSYDGGELAFAFSANDVESTGRLFESLSWAPEKTTLLYNGRGDRPGRDAAFERFFSDRRWRAIVRIDSASAHEQDDAALVRSISGRGRVFGCGNAAGAPLRLLSLLDGEERHE